MKQIFILGASSVYGVGAERGWADLVKSYVHGKQFAPGGSGETCEVFNFAKAGSTIEFIAETFPWFCENYQRGPELITLICVGGNDAKAVGTPENYVCTPEAFKEKLTNLCQVLKAHSQRVIFVSNGYLDESKVNPKVNPLTGANSYFTNERRGQFNAITKNVCASMGFDFVAPTCDQDAWTRSYLYQDGLHPNQAGYELMFAAIQPKLDALLS